MCPHRAASVTDVLIRVSSLLGTYLGLETVNLFRVDIEVVNNDWVLGCQSR